MGLIVFPRRTPLFQRGQPALRSWSCAVSSSTAFLSGSPRVLRLSVIWTAPDPEAS
jgi:hypothetical protein